MDEEVFTKLINTAIAVGVSFAIYWILARAGRHWVKKMGDRGADDGARARTLWSMVHKVLAIVIGVTAVLGILSVWEVSLAPFLAVGSAVGVAVGFGAQSLVSDIIAGFFILAEGQFKIGDWISVLDQVEGEVQEIRLRITVLVDLSGDVHYVPNSEIRISTNHSQGEGQLIDITVAHGSPVSTVFEIMSEEFQALTEDPDWKDLIHGVPTVLGVQSLDGLGITVRASLMAAPADKFAVRREALRRLTERLASEGIEIPAPVLGQKA